MYYRLDAEDRIVELSADWDAVALAHGGDAAASHAILGRRLDEFLSGDATRMFVRAAVQAARIRPGARVLPYRCDTPQERRRFDMVLVADEGGGVTVEHRLTELLPRSSRAPRAPAAFAGLRCSQCLAIRRVGRSDWEDCSDPGDAPLARDVCPACARALFEQDPPMPVDGR